MELSKLLIKNLSGEDKIHITKGKAKAILPEERNKKYYQFVTDFDDRSYDKTLRERIELPSENGMLIGKNTLGGVIDDRKLRYSGHQKSDGRGNYILGIAPVHFGELQSVDKRAVNDEEFRDRVMRLGLANFENERAYFANVMGITALPLTRDNEVVLFQRAQKIELYPGYWHAMGGQLVPDLERYDLFKEERPSDKFRKLLREEMEKEVLEEMNLTSDLVNLSLRLLEADVNVSFDYLARINLPSELILERIRSAKDRKEHQNILVLKNMQEVTNFLDREKTITPGAKFLLNNFLSQ